MSHPAIFVEELGQPGERDNEFFTDVVAGLSKEQKTLPCKYFYDETGSQLFEKICETPEYYITRTECAIYQKWVEEITQLIGSQALVVEPGAGSVRKIAILLEHLPDPAGFIPMDISTEILAYSSEVLSRLFPNIDITPMTVDFSNAQLLKKFFIPLSKRPRVKKRVIFFPGSTIGNFHPNDARNFLANFADNLLPGDGLLIGVDLVKDQRILEAAYNDDKGITANFNLNLLHRISNELNATINIDAFSHKAIFNKAKSRIEMHLVSEAAQCIGLDGQIFSLDEKETIHTEYSYKYDVKRFSALAQEAGFNIRKSWVDDEGLFSVHYLQVV